MIRSRELKQNPLPVFPGQIGPPWQRVNPVYRDLRKTLRNYVQTPQAMRPGRIVPLEMACLRILC